MEQPTAIAALRDGAQVSAAVAHAECPATGRGANRLEQRRNARLKGVAVLIIEGRDGARQECLGSRVPGERPARSSQLQVYDAAVIGIERLGHKTGSFDDLDGLDAGAEP